jgi:hypothetical protein
MPTRRAVRKKLGKKFQVGDVVTWGYGLISHRVAEVTSTGVYVDTTSQNFGQPIADGRRRMFIEFSPGSKSHRCPGPPRHSELAPDRSEYNPYTDSFHYRTNLVKKF